MLSFHSFLAESIRRFIALRQLSGTDYHSQTLLLGAFDRFVAGQVVDDEPRVTRELVDAYQQSLSTLAPRTRGNRMCVVRQLCRYLATRAFMCPSPYVPSPPWGHTLLTSTAARKSWRCWRQPPLCRHPIRCGPTPSAPCWVYSTAPGCASARPWLWIWPISTRSNSASLSPPASSARPAGSPWRRRFVMS